MCQHYRSYFSLGTIPTGRRYQRRFAARPRLCVFVAKPPVTPQCYWPCVLPLFLFYFQRKPLCESLRMCVCVSVPSFLCASPHKRTQKPGTMQRALAEETDFCPTPTNRKLLLHPPHPAFVSHADTHTCMHADGKRNHAVPEH